MGDLNDFLSSQESPAPERVDPTEGTSSPEPVENEPPTEPEEQHEEGQPSGQDRRDQAIWREEREKRKALQQQVEQMNTRWQEMMQRMQAPPQPQQQPQAPQPQAEEIPNFEDDPIGHLKARNDLLERQLTQAQQYQNQQAQQVAQVQQFNQLRGTVDQMETEFAQVNPDYHEAVGYLYQQVEKMASAMGYPPQMKQQIVSQTAMDISVRALQQGRSPAELAYEAARSMGWGAAPAPADDGFEASPAPKPRAAPTSLGAVAGKQQGGNPTWDSISKMNDKEFDAWWKNFERQQRGR